MRVEHRAARRGRPRRYDDYTAGRGWMERERGLELSLGGDRADTAARGYNGGPGDGAAALVECRSAGAVLQEVAGAAFHYFAFFILFQFYDIIVILYYIMLESVSGRSRHAQIAYAHALTTQHTHTHTRCRCWRATRSFGTAWRTRIWVRRARRLPAHPTGVARALSSPLSAICDGSTSPLQLLEAWARHVSRILRRRGNTNGRGGAGGTQ